jgi:hypothetical protein
MNRQEAQWRLLGADDFIKIFVKSLENIGIFQNQPVAREDLKKTEEMMNHLRQLLILRYQREIKWEELR